MDDAAELHPAQPGVARSNCRVSAFNCRVCSARTKWSWCCNSQTLPIRIGVRDRAMLETLYSTGMRRMELLKLKLYDVDRRRGVVTIREGKGKKDRVIPIGERALAWMDKYLNEVRPVIVVEPDDGTCS